MKVFKKFVSLVGLVSWSWRELGQESVLLKVTCTTLFLKLGWVSNFEETNWVTTYLTAPPSSCPGARTLSRHSRGLSSCPLCLRADGRQESHDPVSYLSARRAQRLVWPGWSVPANWVRLEDDHSSLRLPHLWTSNLLSRRGCIFMLAAEDLARRPTGVWEKCCEAYRERERLARPEAADHAVAWSVLAHFYKACLGLLTSPSLHSNNLSSNLAPPTFPGLYNLPLLIPAKL